MFVKICGLSTPETVTAAVRAGADAIGFVLSASPRQVSPAAVCRLRREVPPHVLAVAVFGGVPTASAWTMAQQAEVDAIQLHGNSYSRADFVPHGLVLIRAVGFTAPDLRTGAYGEDLLLVDAPVPGSGRPWDYSTLAHHRLDSRWLLAGGLTPATVAGAIRSARPWGVDVSSGVESSRGIKDTTLIQRFVDAARGAPAE